jgi:ATP-dependent Lhr-like helicase
VTGERNERLLLLAGRSWLVTAVDWSKRIVWLEPAREGGKARWIGTARSLGHDVCQGIRSVLASGAPPNVTLSRRAQAALLLLSEEIPMSVGSHFVVSRTADGPERTWTFAGTRANRTWAHQASLSGKKARFDALSVQAPPTFMFSTAPVTLTEDEATSFSESIKFADCVPRKLLFRMIISRYFEAVFS